MNLLETAFDWLVQGFSVIPIKFKDKSPALSGWKIYQTQLPTYGELAQWFSNQQRNIALITGWNDLVVIDFDNMDVFWTWYALLPLQTYMVKTARGVHVYLKIAEPIHSKHTDFIDIKAGGGYVLIPPSIHPTGYIYQVLSSASILSINTLSEVLPEQLLSIERQPDPIKPAPIETNIWESIENPFTGQADLLNKIRQHHKIETFFPGAIETGQHWLTTNCPFHSDKHPSFWIDTNKQLCGCFSGCTPKPLDIVNLVAKLHRLSNKEAIVYLAKTL